MKKIWIVAAVVLEIFSICAAIYCNEMCKAPFANLKLYSPLGIGFMVLSIILFVAILVLLVLYFKS